MRKLIFTLLGIVFVGGGAYFAYHGIYLSKRGGNFAVLSVNTPYSEAGVFIDDNFMGPTPFFKDDLKPGVKTVRVGDWVGKVTLTPAALTVINQDLGPTSSFTAGEVIWLEKTAGKTSLAVICTPDGSEIRIDGEKIGETPLVTSEVMSGEHKLTVSKQAYVTREIRIRVQENHKLNVNVQLMLKSVPDEVKIIDTGVENLEIKDLSLSDKQVLSDIPSWVQGASFYLKSYETVSEGRIDYFLDYEGNFYSASGDPVAVEEMLEMGDKITIGYLGSKETDALSQAAVEAINRFVKKNLPEQEIKPKVEILPTGTGWLRVRSGPGLGNEEIAKVDVGEKFEILEEQSGWYKIELPDDKEGWISGQFAKKIEE